MSMEQLSGLRGMTQLSEIYAGNGKREAAGSAGITPSSWGPDTISISVYAREQLDALLKSEAEAPPEQAKCLLKVGGKTVDIVACLEEYQKKNIDDPEAVGIFNEFTHGGPEGLVKALSKVTGMAEGDIKNALQSMNAAEAADFAVGLGELLGVPPSIFEKSLGGLTGLSEALLEKQLQTMLGADYRKAEAITVQG